MPKKLVSQTSHHTRLLSCLGHLPFPANAGLAIFSVTFYIDFLRNPILSGQGHDLSKTFATITFNGEPSALQSRY